MVQREEKTVTNSKIPSLTLSLKTIEVMYSGAYFRYVSEKYEEAALLFRFLVLVDPKNKKFWTGLGATYQMLNDYDKALQCWVMAAKLDTTDHSSKDFGVSEDFQKLEDAEDTFEECRTISVNYRANKTFLSCLHLLKKCGLGINCNNKEK